MIRHAMLILSAFALLLGCAQEVPISKRDLDFARKDLELEREKYKTFVGSKERGAIEQQIKDHRYEWYIDLDTEEKPSPNLPNAEESRIKEFNNFFEKQMHEAKQPAQKE